MNSPTTAAAVAPDGPVLLIEQWAAWAPGLATQDAWRDWLRNPQPLPADAPASPPLAEVPAMARRRIDPLGRAALQAAYWAQQDVDAAALPAMPLVFASRWGELARSISMLQELAQGEALSPTAFSHSVHNAIGAQYSIQRGITANVSAVAAGEVSAAAGWVEAQALLATGAATVLLTVFDAPLPGLYASTGLDAPVAPLHAYALRLRAARAGESGVLLARQPSLGPAAPATLAPNLQVLQFLLEPAAELRQPDGAADWQWRHVVAR
ncbi:beta-ketoacyl synthase chain length factor [Roseateles sp. NT4]|uniref:beta-ketoacyl synthase chain length factor n=1 Tax=Roseateles sp. NT4 TaxID=3453715 RepID=UPI003EEB3A22